MRAACLMLVLLVLGACSTVGPPRELVIDGDPERLIVVAVANPAIPVVRRAGGTPRGYGAARYRISPAAQRDLAAVARAHGLSALDAWPIDIIGMHCAVLQIPAGRSRTAVLDALSADPRVELAQPLQTFVTGSTAYDDPYVGLQAGLRDMNIRGAHALATGKGVRVAVVDTGVDYEHPDLADRVAAHEDLVRGDSRDFRRDVHGTAVAGVIAAVANNSMGIVGVAPQARILAMKACWHTRDEHGPAAARCNSFTLARAIVAAIERGAQVINLSLSGPADPLLTRLLEAAMGRGILVVAAEAAGSAQRATFPADMPGVIGVRAAGDSDGSPTRGGLQAPGREILTLRPGARYDFESGSSMAAAHVSGVVALLLEHRSSLAAGEILGLLERSIQEVTFTGPSVQRGIDACAALAALLDSGECPHVPDVRTAAAGQKKPLRPTK